DGPMIMVNWHYAAVYCNWLSEREGLPEAEWCYHVSPASVLGVAPRLDRKGYRLPTEAEWEYTCRAGALTSRHYGHSVARLGKYAWHRENAAERAHPSGRLRPNDLGMFDMLGNVAEWCQDGLAPYPPGNVIDDTEKLMKSALVQPLRVMRGGTFSRLPR